MDPGPLKNKLVVADNRICDKNRSREVVSRCRANEITRQTLTMGACAHSANDCVNQGRPVSTENTDRVAKELRPNLLHNLSGHSEVRELSHAGRVIQSMTC